MDVGEADEEGGNAGGEQGEGDAGGGAGSGEQQAADDAGEEVEFVEIVEMVGLGVGEVGEQTGRMRQDVAQHAAGAPGPEDDQHPGDQQGAADIREQAEAEHQVESDFVTQRPGRRQELAGVHGNQREELGGHVWVEGAELVIAGDEHRQPEDRVDAADAAPEEFRDGGEAAEILDVVAGHAEAAEDEEIGDAERADVEMREDALGWSGGVVVGGGRGVGDDHQGRRNEAPKLQGA